MEHDDETLGTLLSLYGLSPEDGPEPPEVQPGDWHVRQAAPTPRLETLLAGATAGALSPREGGRS